MFLFEGPFGTILHTGDCRFTPDCLSALLPFLARRIDCCFLDCTFARCPLQFPTKEDSIRQVNEILPPSCTESIAVQQSTIRQEHLWSEFSINLLLFHF